jgi:competence protein ComEC
MVEWGRAGPRAASWPQGARVGPRVRWPPQWFDDFVNAHLARLHKWSAVEARAGRLLPWLSIAYGFGILLYFTAAHEPVLWAPALASAVCGAFVVALRARPTGLVIAAAAACTAIGFTVATFKTARIAHPVLARPVYDAMVTGWVEVEEERARTDRIVVGVATITSKRMGTPLERVRVTVRRGTAPPVGSFVSFKARLSPPLAPLRPGSYDFARDLYFQQIGATGFALGAIHRLPPPGLPSRWLRFQAFVAGVRDAIDARIRAALPGDVGAIASALITGKRDAISTPVNDAMYISSLAHVLSISGYHMAVVAGVVFFVVRGLLALSATLALRYPIKKWAAGVALIAATAYLILSGSEVATQRSYLMTAIVLAGVMVDRPALTMRTLTVAVFGVLLLAPEAVVHPSFQMSFAATLALIAGYERGLPWMMAGADTPLGARIALWGGREIVSLITASTVAGFATTLYAAYHFHRLAPYGTLANLLAMPVVSAWVMPMGLVALLAMPFGFDAVCWQLMGKGIEWMDAVALWVASLPGAIGRMPAFGTGPLLIATAGFLIVCLLRSPLRWCGAAIVLLGIFLALRTPRPDVLIAPDAEAVAVRQANGRLAILKLGHDTFALREWLAADGDARMPGDPTLRDGFACDEVGCTARLADGALVATPQQPEAFAEDCRRAALVLTRRTAPPGCTAKFIDRTIWPHTGAAAFVHTPQGFTMTVARPADQDRPWAPAPAKPVAAVTKAPARAVAPPASPDATPNARDLRPDD